MPLCNHSCSTITPGLNSYASGEIKNANNFQVKWFQQKRYRYYNTKMSVKFLVRICNVCAKQNEKKLITQESNNLSLLGFKNK